MTHFPFHHPIPEEEEPRIPQVDWLLLLILMLLIIAIVYFAPKTLPPPDTGGVTVGEVAINENPELLAFRRYQAAAEIAAASKLARRSPEILTAQRFLEQLANSKEILFLAQNPEVGLFQRYQAQEFEFLAQNPEVSLFQRYQAQQH